MAFRETFGGDVEGAVEARPGILPSDYGCEFDELTFGESLAKRGVQFIGYVCGRMRELEHNLLLFVEIRAGLEV